jgi:hypothetical protein
MTALRYYLPYYSIIRYGRCFITPDVTKFLFLCMNFYFVQK